MTTSYNTPGSESRAWKSIRAINFRPADGSGPARAYCDVRIEFTFGGLTALGFSVVQQNGKDAWVGFPRKASTAKGRALDRKWFPVFEADGELRRLIIAAVLDAFGAWSKGH